MAGASCARPSRWRLAHGGLTGLTLDTLLLIQAAIHGKVMLKSDPDALRTTDSLEYGASAALLRLAKDIGLEHRH